MSRVAGALALSLGLLLWAPIARALPIQQVAGTSGVQAWLVEDHTLPVVSLRFVFAGGAALDPASKGGTAAMVAALLDEGAGPYDTTEFHARLGDLASDISFYAGQDEFGGSLRSLTRNLSQSAELLRLALNEPHFAAEAVERIRGDTLAGLARQARSPRSLAARLWMRDAFESHPYGSNTEGTEASVAVITREDLGDFVAGNLRRSGLLVGVVGDVTPAEAAALLDTVFGSLPAGAAAAEIAEATPEDDGALVVRRSPVPQSVVTFGQAAPKRDDPEWYAALVLNDILGGSGFRGRLMQEIREKRGLAYGVSTELVSYRHAGLIIGNVATANARVAQSIALVRQEWGRMRDEGPSADELAGAKTYLTGSFPLDLDSTQRIAALLVQLQVNKLGIDYLDRRAGLINAVTLDEARGLAHRLFDPDRLSFVVVGDPQDVTPSEPARPAQH